MRGVCFVILCAIALPGCKKELVEPGHPEPVAIFEALLQKPVPSSVTNLQGMGDTWQGYSAHLRFNAANQDIDAIIAKGYKRAEWSKIAFLFPGSDRLKNFTPAWDPSSIQNMECYEAAVTNSWTHAGNHYLVIDRSTGTVYFYGGGS